MKNDNRQRHFLNFISHDEVALKIYFILSLTVNTESILFQQTEENKMVVTGSALSTFWFLKFKWKHSFVKNRRKANRSIILIWINIEKQEDRAFKRIILMCTTKVDSFSIHLQRGVSYEDHAPEEPTSTWVAVVYSKFSFPSDFL